MPDERTITETRDVEAFDRVCLGGFGTARVTQGESLGLVVEAAEEVMPRVTSEVRDGVLHLGLEKGWLDGLRREKLNIRFEVSMVDVAGLTLSGVGRIDAPSVETDTLSLVVSGAGAIEVGSVKAKSLEVVLSGAGSCEVAGEVETQSLKLSGAGSYMATELDSVTASVVVSGAGDAAIQVSETLDARVSGTGSIRYHGGATVRQRVTGVGSVRCMCDE